MKRKIHVSKINGICYGERRFNHAILLLTVVGFLTIVGSVCAQERDNDQSADRELALVKIGEGTEKAGSDKEKTADLSERERFLLDKIEQLERRIEVLEKGK